MSFLTKSNDNLDLYFKNLSKTSLRQVHNNHLNLFVQVENLQLCSRKKTVIKWGYVLKIFDLQNKGIINFKNKLIHIMYTRFILSMNIIRRY